MASNADTTTQSRARADYQKRVTLDASPEAVFEALATLSGIARWLAPVEGSPEEGGELRVAFADERPLVLQVDAARAPSTVVWSVLSCDRRPEWVGTTIRFALGTSIRFALGRSDADGCVLSFRHEGLVPELDCYAECRDGWDYFLSKSLVSYVETGRGAPFVKTESSH